MDTSSRTVRCGRCSGPTFHSCPHGTCLIQRLGYSVGYGNGHPGTDPRPSTFQTGRIPSWHGSYERYALPPVADVRHWLLLLLSLIWEELQYLVRLVLDGCFWHGCPEHLRPAKINESFRSTKDRGNRQRDQDADRQLAEAGRTVVRVWEHEDPQTAARRIAEVVGGLSMDRTSLRILSLRTLV